MTNDSETTDKSQRAEQIRPDDVVTFLGAVMQCSAETVNRLAEHVYPDDLDEPAASVYRAALALASQNVSPTPALIRGELKRHGLSRAVELCILNAITAGAERRAIRLYAANVVADRLRVLYGSLGHALATGADTEAEASLPVLAEQAAKTIRVVADRLDGLRGE